MTYCYGLYGLSAFSNRLAVLRKLLVWQQKRKFGTIVNISLTKKYGNCEKLENTKKSTMKNSKSRNYVMSHNISGKALHHFTASQLHRQSRTALILLQHAASQQCLSKTFITFFLSEKEKIFITKAMVILRPKCPAGLNNLAQCPCPRETRCKTSCAKRFN